MTQQNYLTLPGRALIAWMEGDRAELLLAGQRPAARTAAHKERVVTAQRALAERPPLRPTESVITPAPDALAEHERVLRSTKPGMEFFQNGYRLVLVDLRQVIALQEQVLIRDADHRVQGLDSRDWKALAQITIPTPVPPAIPAQFDQASNTWIINSSNKNLRIIGNWGGPVQNGLICFGFAVALMQSFVQLINYQSRCYLRDGYHRACGFLKRGIYVVPALCKESRDGADLTIEGEGLSLTQCLSDRPPLLTDYFDERVSADIQLPQSQKNIIIQGLQFNSYLLNQPH